MKLKPVTAVSQNFKKMRESGSSIPILATFGDIPMKLVKKKGDTTNHKEGEKGEVMGT